MAAMSVAGSANAAAARDWVSERRARARAQAASERAVMSGKFERWYSSGVCLTPVARRWSQLPRQKHMWRTICQMLWREPPTPGAEAGDHAAWAAVRSSIDFFHDAAQRPSVQASDHHLTISSRSVM